MTCPPKCTVAALTSILDEFAVRSPRTRIVVQTILPRGATATAIIATNRAVAELAAARGVELLDLHEAFDDGSGGLRPEDTTDGWHLSDSGYARWADALGGALANQTR